MKLLDERGIGTVWSICKEKFALEGHTHNSLAAVGNEQISATAYGSGLHFKPYYSSGGPTNYGNILEYTSTNTGGGQLAMEWTGSQTESDGTDSNVGRVYYRSKRDCINGWTKWMTLAYTNDIPTKLSQLTNDKGFVTGSVIGNTVTINGTSTTWTNTWRGIQDNLTSTSTSDSLSANQGKVLKGLIDSKANSSDLSSYPHKNQAISLVQFQFDDYGQQYLKTVYADEHKNGTAYMLNASPKRNGCMSKEDKVKLDGIASGANNYSLPVASQNILGGILSSPISGTNTSLWPITVTSQAIACTNINGLMRSPSGSIGSIFIESGDYTTNYSATTIRKENVAQNKSAVLDLPGKSGTLALTDDIPDVSNLCKFNFVNSISECKSDRINFLLGFTGYDIDLSDFDDYPNGTILLMSTTNNSISIRHKSGRWYSAGDDMNTGDSNRMYIGEINLVTKNNGMVHHYKL